jgi:hypothetical protein
MYRLPVKIFTIVTVFKIENNNKEVIVSPLLS